MPGAKPGPYTTKLSPAEERDFQSWVKTNRVPWQDSPTADYDMRGYYQALREGKAKQSLDPYDRRMHFPDTWKTPYHSTFSNESIYSTPEAPHWEGNRLMTPQGSLIYDESKRGTIESPLPVPAVPKPTTTLR
jgi:hypothetical protein